MAIPLEPTLPIEEPQVTELATPVDDDTPSSELEGQTPPDLFADDQAFGLPEDETQVAGIIKGAGWISEPTTDVGRAKKALRQQGEAAPAPTARTDVAAERIGNRIVITNADETTAQRFRDALDLPPEHGIPLISPNLSRHNLADVEKEYIEALHILWEDEIKVARRGKMKIDDIVAEAQSIGMNEAVLQLMKKNIGDAFGPEQMARAIWVRLNAAVELDRVMADGSTEELLQLLPLMANIEMKTSGAIAETGRTMAVLSHAGRIGALNKADKLSTLPELLKRYNVNEGDVDNVRAAYLALPSHNSRLGYTRSLMSKGLDVWAELYINALLSSPITHMVNVTSNALFGLFQLPERALAGVIGALRTNIFRGMTNQERVYMGESVAALSSWRQALLDASVAAWRGLRHEQETFGAMSKVDVRERRAISAEFLGIDPDKHPIGAKAVNTIGILTRFMGSRMLLMEDEFAKGIAFQAELHAQAHRRMQELAKKGMSVDDAAIEGAAILAGRDVTATKTAQEMAQRLTFQGDLGKFAQTFSKIMSHPLAKIIVPFYKTPTNIIKETLARTPLGIMPGSGFWTDIRKGGAAADMAMSRITLGSGIFATFAWFAAGEEGSDVILTGAGPTDKKALAAWRRLKLVPHSIAFRQDDGSYESVDYSRLAPIAGVLSMAADYAHYSQYEDDATVLEQLAMAGPLAMYDTMKALPMMEGLFSIAEIFGSEYETGPDKARRTLELVAKQLTSAGIVSIPLAPTGSLTATVERTLSPYASNVRPSGDQIDAGPLGRGFYEALQKAKSRNPFFSDSVEVKLNLWAEEMKSCENGLQCFISPVRVISSDFNDVDKEMVRLGLGVPKPKRTQRGVKFNAEQENRLLLIMNNIDRGDDAGTMLEEMRWQINQEDYQDAPLGDNEEEGIDGKITMLRAIVTSRKTEALDMMFGSDVSLQRKADTRAIEIERTGKAPRP